MSEFDYLVFVNDAKQPIAGFAFNEDAVIWVTAKRWSRHCKVEIRKAGKVLAVFFADTHGRAFFTAEGQDGQTKTQLDVEAAGRGRGLKLHPSLISRIMRPA
jgi:hypothetical protein